MKNGGVTPCNKSLPYMVVRVAKKALLMQGFFLAKELA